MNIVYENLMKYSKDKTYNLGLIPIYPKFSSLIYSGEKKVEFRKRPPREGVSTFLIYETKPISCITGFFTIDGYLSDTPQNLWQQTKNFAGIDFDGYSKYFWGHNTAYAFTIVSAHKFRANIYLTTLGLHTPQTVVYL